ncbi:hypothetical protein BC827DRAFT_196110 [Russula dissimulans]|nr:hypothetical protein BC827DRAFT_196110 [Russula dissimulans]
MLSIDHLNKVISNIEYTISSLPRSHPQFPLLLSVLGVARLSRYKVSDDERDLDTSISQLAHAIFLPSGLSINDLHPNAFFHLAVALFHRSQKLKHLGSVKYCVKYLHFFGNNHWRPSESNAMTSQHYLCVHWLFRWSWSLEMRCSALRRYQLYAPSSSPRISTSHCLTPPS